MLLRHRGNGTKTDGRLATQRRVYPITINAHPTDVSDRCYTLISRQPLLGDSWGNRQSAAQLP